MHALTGGLGQPFHIEFIAHGDPMLLAAGTDDRIHRYSSGLFRTPVDRSVVAGLPTQKAALYARHDARIRHAASARLGSRRRRRCAVPTWSLAVLFVSTRHCRPGAGGLLGRPRGHGHSAATGAAPGRAAHRNDVPARAVRVGVVHVARIATEVDRLDIVACDVGYLGGIGRGGRIAFPRDGGASRLLDGLSGAARAGSPRSARPNRSSPLGGLQNLRYQSGRQGLELAGFWVARSNPAK